ncbi:hypothetical protein IMG5_008720 [Ichthyophthirius multifiliis]|uniref:ABC transporter domain-containing protein n=1 Tax=Ichthyophthirius multifiliis TaxID=5932 RepID=G0QJT0_ICHMU|nr:hypothetical protein IMG5_008720 [Ichthyophthirius multifiliis]EGR34523.1 hypothetical protein IMG5_008720 [Ichthyophthirius multifiliis]|eukprot:XP_004039827.1 hypothetical protein IMG5_008720 [Ichthyophthirius multifiliis]
MIQSFGNTHAVNGISLNLYENQILCLLGHNGAGKTTTISLLTGLIQKTEGKISYFENDLEENLDQIRQNIGLCTQKDVLYDDLTIEEHLEFIARIKGIQCGKKIKEDVEKIIVLVTLQDERKKLAKNLSGGNKRKLSLGMALIGGSRIIFLDEPTSGMDTMSRINIWKILEKIQNRTIVLTTHHLEEAEKLAHRIAIMNFGKLLILGSSEYIKQKFGVGYNCLVQINSQKKY